jgi:hypothetical protein
MPRLEPGSGDHSEAGYECGDDDAEHVEKRDHNGVRELYTQTGGHRGRAPLSNLRLGT